VAPARTAGAHAEWGGELGSAGGPPSRGGWERRRLPDKEGAASNLGGAPRPEEAPPGGRRPPRGVAAARKGHALGARSSRKIMGGEPGGSPGWFFRPRKEEVFVTPGEERGDTARWDRWWDARWREERALRTRAKEWWRTKQLARRPRVRLKKPRLKGNGRCYSRPRRTSGRGTIARDPQAFKGAPQGVTGGGLLSQRRRRAPLKRGGKGQRRPTRGGGTSARKGLGNCRAQN